MANLAKRANFQLGALTVSPSHACIDAGGHKTHIEPKVMDMLIALVEAGGQTISRDEMIERCWGGRIVSDDAITRILSKVRQIRTLSEPPAFDLQTLPKVGSRLVVHEASAEPIVIVLPFDNLGGRPELDFFCDGVADEILRRLVRGANLKVIGRTTSFQYRGERKALAAAELRASHVVDGTLQRAGDQLRIHVHLSEAGSGTGLWAQKFDCSVDDIFQVQDEIADQISVALDTVFHPPSNTPIAPALYDLFLRTKALRPTPDEGQANINSLTALVSAAPNFADGWARLATSRVWQMLQLPYQDRPTQMAKARQEIARCRALDPDNPETFYAEFWMVPAVGDFEAKETFINRLLAATPNASDANSVASFHLFNVGRCRAALAYAKLAFALDPRDWAASINYGICLWEVGFVDEAIAAFENHLIEWPDDHMTSALLIIAYARAEQWGKLDRIIAPNRLSRYPLREHSGIVAVALAMRYPSAQNNQMLLASIKDRVARSGSSDLIIMFWAAHLGMTDEIYDLAANTHFGPTGGRHDMLGVVAYRAVSLFKTAFPAVRNDPRFVILCARLGLVRYWVNTGQWPDCADEVPYDFRAACRDAMHIPVDDFMKPQSALASASV